MPVLADAEGDVIVRVHHSRALLEVLSDEIVDESCERNDSRKGSCVSSRTDLTDQIHFVEFILQFENAALCCNSTLGDMLSHFTGGQTMLTLPHFRTHRSVPTEDQILVPETLLKKRKSQEKAREEQSAEREKLKKVRTFHVLYNYIYSLGDGLLLTMVMTLPNTRLDFRVDAVAFF